MNYEAVCRFLSLSGSMELDRLIPGPASPQIKIDAVNLSVEQTIREIVNTCYDIRLDDRQLRQLVLLPEAERGKYFQKLRAEYRIRREFFNFTVSLPNNANEISNVLRLLGLK